MTTQEIARPLQAEIDELIEIIQDLLTVIHDHHSDNVMREDRHICPVCTDKESVKIIQRAMQKRYELA